MAQVFRRVSHMRPVMAVTILAAIGWGTYAQEDDRATRSVAEGPPRIVATTPAAGATDVDPTTSEIVVTFDRDMGGGFSWTGGGPDYPPIAEEQKPHWRDKRTAVLPVKLEAAHYYRVGINSKSHRNFRSTAGVPAKPSAIYFTTHGASDELKARTTKPAIVSMSPVTGQLVGIPAILTAICATDYSTSGERVQQYIAEPQALGYCQTMS